MLKYSTLLRAIKDLIVDREFVRPVGEGPEAEKALDLIMETVCVLDYDSDYLPGGMFEKVVNDSRKVSASDVFVAIKGAAADGIKFVPQVLEKGTRLIISQTKLDPQVMLPGSINLVVSDSYAAYGRLCEAMYDYPCKAMKLFALTGTNGKTTSAMLLRMLLNKNSLPCGMISTVEYDTGNGEIISAERTTPEAAELFELFDRMRQNSLGCAVMEVSSHALKQNRIGTLKFHAAVFTNLTGDHLDYHHTMEEYFNAKKLLFTEHLTEDGTAIINCDDAYGRRLAEELADKKVITFGRTNGQWRINNIQTSFRGTTFSLSNNTVEYKFETNLTGVYNVYNVVGVLLALHTSNTLDLEIASQLLEREIISVPGRLERFTLPNGAAVFVDYAHTHDALSNVLSTLADLPHDKISVVFGAGGDRDRTKRPLMGKAASEKADMIYVTSDNPRNEEVSAIISDIVSGFPAGNPHAVISDRKEAIITALNAATGNDIVLIAGKGHETYQEINGIKNFFDDRQVVKDFIAGVEN